MLEFEDQEVDPKETPLCKKAHEILEAVTKLGELIPEENEMLQHLKSIMTEDALMIYVKSMSGTKLDLFDMKMEAATLVRKSANSLYVQIHALEMNGFDHFEYFRIVRNLIDELKPLFVDWVERFDRWDYQIDRWGLFNPPGVGPYDKDPDDDIPFDPRDYGF